MGGRTPTWIVQVTSEEPDNARHWSLRELGDMVDKYGEDTEELAEALGPPAGFQAVQVYRPYTERQARRLAERLNEPTARERLDIALALPLQLQRFESLFVEIDTQPARNTGYDYAEAQP